MPAERTVRKLADLPMLKGRPLMLFTAEDCIRDLEALRKRLPVEDPAPVWFEGDEIDEVMTALRHALEADAAVAGTSESAQLSASPDQVEFLADRLDNAVQAIRQGVKALGRPPRYTALLLPQDASDRYEVLLAGGYLPIASVELFDVL